MWSDRWILTDSLGTPFRPTKKVDQDIMVSGLLCRGTNEWNAARVKSLFPLIAEKILSIRPSIFGAIDIYVWPLNTNGTTRQNQAISQLLKTKQLSTLKVSYSSWNGQKKYGQHFVSKRSKFLHGNCVKVPSPLEQIWKKGIWSQC